MNKNAFISEHGELSNEILLNVAEILTLRLPEGTERVTASKWVKKFLACKPENYKNALSLFISTLTKQVLVKPFDKPPSEPRDQWQGFDREYTGADINEAVKARLYRDALTPPYKVEIDDKFKEYLAFQEIPFFGAHFYFAFSPNETIETWQNFNKLRVPKKFSDALKLSSEIESPIKGGFGSHPKDRIRKPPSIVASKARIPLKKKPVPNKKTKAEWQGPIEEEEKEPEPEPVKKNMIVIPTDGPTKAIPEALQRRMLEAERQKAERMLSKGQDNHVRSKKATPAISGLKKSFGLPRKSLDAASKSGSSKKLQDDIIREISASDSATSREVQIDEPKIPETVHERFAALKAKTLSNLPAELEKASNDLNEGLRKAQADGVADPAFVDEIQEREIQIANQLKDMLDKYDNQIEVVEENVRIVEDDIEALTFSARKINVDLKKTIIAPQTLDKIQELYSEVKEIPKIVAEAKTRKDALFTLQDEQIIALSEQPEVNGNAEKLLTLMGNIVGEAKSAMINLNTIDPTTSSEQDFIANSIGANKELIEEIGKASEKLITTIERNDSKIDAVSAQLAGRVRTAIETFNRIDIEFAKELVPTTPILDAVGFQAEKAAQLGTIHAEMGDLVKVIRAENIGKTLHETLQQLDHEPQHPSLRRQLGLENEIEDEVFDIDGLDVDFEGGVVDDEEFLNATRAQSKKYERQQTQFDSLYNEVADQENLNDVTENFADILNLSIENANDIIKELVIAEEDPEFSEEQQISIAQTRADVEKIKESLERSRGEVEEVLVEAQQPTQQATKKQFIPFEKLTDADYDELFGP